LDIHQVQLHRSIVLTCFTLPAHHIINTHVCLAERGNLTSSSSPHHTRRFHHQFIALFITNDINPAQSSIHHSFMHHQQPHACTQKIHESNMICRYVVESKQMYNNDEVQ
jgi:hypothetical protein